MNKIFLTAPLALALQTAWADGLATQDLEPVVVTGTRQEKANTIQFKTRQAIQPLPANDGADLLKAVPNMSIIRKGGSSGDPLFRGLGGSRLSIRADDQFIYGGCGGRMDPPTAYVFPTAYDKVVITKGPQSVTQGMGLVGGAVQFVRDKPDFSDKGYDLTVSTTVGSHGRIDGLAEAALGSTLAYVRANASYNKSDDYQDGSGNRVHSRFKRNSQMLQVGLTPNTDSELAATYERSRGEAAYADRMMDGSQFDRDAWNIRATQRNLTDTWQKLELRYGKSKVDHIMDNFSLRTPGHHGMKMLSNPKRDTDTAQLNSTFAWDNVQLQTGIDYMNDKHAARSGTDYAEKAYTPTQSFTQWGAFAEASWAKTAEQTWTAGLRHDQVKAVYEPYPHSDPAKNQRYRLNSGFIRWETQNNGGKYYAGIGSAERAPDYWERNVSEDLKPERNTQIDTGVIWKNNRWHTSLSLFAGTIKNFILIESQGRSRTGRNIDAHRYGAEAEARYQLLPHWTLGGSLAYTYGTNTTDRRPLAQTPPLEAKATLDWDNGTYSAGLLWRSVAAQHRYAAGQGNIIGQDIGRSAGFGTLSLHGGWRINKHATLQAGIDNVFDKNYAEFVSRGGNAAAGTQTTRVNEPGRQSWIRLQATF
ncbi:TonB-dependent copper receptor [Neisseria lisongii]|uniref:TonB-dependent copper receptor n=1 Tax=Neisseria lisongii TaxID=2912188 RepID=A0AAW5AG02_9NEIS|nr:TonB-dependent copper receptor [Neisseria lisongii]MCF7530249.1 TonB-dependent copper receptor [Neisseria lisongii]